MESAEVRRKALYSLMGDLPPRDRRVFSECVGEEDRGSYILEKLLLDLNGIEPVPAYFVKPKTAEGKFPVVLYSHSHGGRYDIGKDELLRGREYLQEPPYAEALTKWGYSALCVDAWVFGERRGLSESEAFKLMLWRGQVLWGMMVYDGLKALDYLRTRKDVDAGRTAVLGISMGSVMSQWLAALDPEVKVCVDLCCLTDFDALIDSRGLDGHGIYYYVPRLLKEFSTSGINALTAPRPHLGLAGNNDRLTPPAGLDRVDRELSAVYTAAGRPDNWRLSRFNTGHFETAAMRKEIREFLALHL
jgi:dienelactone hydrolase